MGLTLWAAMGVLTVVIKPTFFAINVISRGRPVSAVDLAVAGVGIGACQHAAPVLSDSP